MGSAVTPDEIGLVPFDPSTVTERLRALELPARPPVPRHVGSTLYKFFSSFIFTFLLILFSHVSHIFFLQYICFLLFRLGSHFSNGLFTLFTITFFTVCSTLVYYVLFSLLFSPVLFISLLFVLSLHFPLHLFFPFLLSFFFLYFFLSFMFFITFISIASAISSKTILSTCFYPFTSSTSSSSSYSCNPS